MRTSLWFNAFWKQSVSSLAPSPWHAAPPKLAPGRMVPGLARVGKGGIGGGAGIPPPPQTLGVPSPPQVCGDVHVPQVRVPPQPSEIEPQLSPCAVQVV